MKFLWVVVAVIYDVEQKVTILQMKKKGAINWKAQRLELVVQASNETSENLPDRMFVGEGLSMRVAVEGHRSRYFKCREKGYVRSRCTKNKKENEAPPQKAAKEVKAAEKPENTTGKIQKKWKRKKTLRKKIQAKIWTSLL
uniref:Uncharacterized protein n=1 Tax=Octopus bimaculoides TaxID=37653 RepID=A0A0L8FWZ5_OCTBM